MPNKYILLAFLFVLLSIGVHSQTTNSPANKFFEFSNSYLKDSLSNLLSDDFQLVRTYTTYANDKSSFLDTYLLHSKSFNGKFKILKVVSATEPQEFLVEDQSDYLKYLKVGYPTWKITVSTKDNKVNRVTIDITESYPKYEEDLRIADEKFVAWIKANYPSETQEVLYTQQGLLPKRLKEYSLKKK